MVEVKADGAPAVNVTRAQILAFRRRTGALDERLPPGTKSLHRAAHAGLQDSMPRAALLSIHARVAEAKPDTWADPSLVQVWGPRYQLFVIPAHDVPVFTLARLPDRGKIHDRAVALADRLHDLLGGERMRYDDAGRALGTHGNNLRYAALTGRLVVRWEGARRPVVWTVPPPETTRDEARRELARRYLHVYGPADSAAFAKWAYINANEAARTFAALAPELVEVEGHGHLLARDEEALRADPGPPAPVRLLPSGDPYTLHGTPEQRALLVPDARRRTELWTPRVWPGALLVDGEIAGTWRRDKRTFTIAPWRRLSSAQRDLIAAEAGSLPLPDAGETSITWT